MANINFVVKNDIELKGNLIFEGATADAYETTLAITDPTADRTITFPNATGTVALTSDLSSYLTTSSASSSYQPLDADLTAIADGAWTSGLLKKISPNTWGTITDNSANWDTAYTDRNKWDGGSTGLTPATGRTSLGATTVGANIFILTNPSAISFPKINADNTVVAESSSTHRTSLGLTIGTDVQAYSATLAGINTLGSGTGFLKNTAGTWSYDNSTYLTTSSASNTYAPLAGATFTGNIAINNSNNTALTTTGTAATLFNANATTLNIGGDATTLSIGTISTAAKTMNLFTGATISGATKTLNIGTAGVSGSTTAINIGSSVSGATNNITIGNISSTTSVNVNTGNILNSATLGGGLDINDTINIHNATTTIASTAATSIFTDVLAYSTIEYTIQAKVGSNYRSSKIMLVCNGATTTSFTEYAILENSANSIPVTFTATAASGIVTLNGAFTGWTTGNNITVKVIRTGIV